MPSLVHALVPSDGGAAPGASRQVQRKLTQLLLSPPDAPTARHISAAIAYAFSPQISNVCNRCMSRCACGTQLQSRCNCGVTFGHAVALSYDDLVCRACAEGSVTFDWPPTTRWVQVQQLLSSGGGAIKGTQAVTALREVLRLSSSARAAFTDRNAPSQQFAAAVFAVACSPSGLHRQMGIDDFVDSCHELTDVIGNVVADPGEALQFLDESTFWWSALDDTLADRAKALPDHAVQGVDDFFLCALLFLAVSMRV